MIPEKIRLWIEDQWPNTHYRPWNVDKQQAATETAEYLIRDAEEILVKAIIDASFAHTRQDGILILREANKKWKAKYGEQSDV
jgi:hypothetical protein